MEAGKENMQKVLYTPDCSMFKSFCAYWFWYAFRQEEPLFGREISFNIYLPFCCNAKNCQSRSQVLVRLGIFSLKATV